MPLESSYVLILRKAINGDKIPAKGFNYIWMFDIFKQKILLARLVIQLLLLFYALGTFTNILLTEGGHFFLGGGGVNLLIIARPDCIHYFGFLNCHNSVSNFKTYLMLICMVKIAVKWWDVVDLCGAWGIVVEHRNTNNEFIVATLKDDRISE